MLRHRRAVRRGLVPWFAPSGLHDAGDARSVPGGETGAFLLDSSAGITDRDTARTVLCRQEDNVGTMVPRGAEIPASAPHPARAAREAGLSCFRKILAVRTLPRSPPIPLGNEHDDAAALDTVAIGVPDRGQGIRLNDRLITA